MQKSALCFLTFLTFNTLLGCGWLAPIQDTSEPHTTPSTQSRCSEDEVEINKRCIQSCNDERDCDVDENCVEKGTKRICEFGAPNDCGPGEVGVFDQVPRCAVECTADENVCDDNQVCWYGTNTQKACFTAPRPIETSCLQSPRPARCDENGVNYEMWQPASTFANLEISTADECCGDINKNGHIDNAVGLAMSFTSEWLKQTNLSMNLREHVWEHDGINLEKDGAYTLQLWRGEKKGDGSWLDYSASDDSAQSKFSAKAELKGDTITAKAPVWRITANTYGVIIPWTIYDVEITATIDRKSSSMEGGITLADGKISGHIKTTEAISEYNAFVRTHCGCIQQNGTPLKAPAIAYNADNIERTSCEPDLDASACDPNDAYELQCRAFVSLTCSYIPLVTTVLPDLVGEQLDIDCLRSDVHRQCDAFSVGMTFNAKETVIKGVTPNR